MLQVYINYPNPMISVHQDVTCTNIGKMRKQGQRQIGVTISTLSAELLRFQNKEYRFAADADLNDMWLQIDFGDTAFEYEVLRFIQTLIGRHYKPLRDITIQQHCP